VRRWALIVIAVVAFLAISALLARWLSVENVERDRVSTLLRAQARGDAAAMLRELPGCAQRPVCARGVAADARALRTPGRVEIAAYESATSHALSSKSGPTRVVWKTPQRLTTVQCVGVRRTGGVLSGVSVTLTALSAPIDRQAPC
jgi:hypothetical protein